jgi:hypothetical protein
LKNFIEITPFMLTWFEVTYWIIFSVKLLHLPLFVAYKVTATM